MTLFRPAVIEAQRRRVYGSVTLHQPARLAAFTAAAVISVAISTADLALGQFARKETVAGWIAPEAGLSAVYAPRGGVADPIFPFAQSQASRIEALNRISQVIYQRVSIPRKISVPVKSTFKASGGETRTGRLLNPISDRTGR